MLTVYFANFFLFYLLMNNNFTIFYKNYIYKISTNLFENNNNNFYLNNNEIQIKENYNENSVKIFVNCFKHFKINIKIFYMNNLKKKKNY